jgi:hypothetical protein
MIWGMNEVLQVLRILTAVRLSDPLAVFNRLALSDAIHLLEYRLLHLEECPESVLVARTSLQEPFRLAVFIYIDKVFREMPPLNLNGLVSRLSGALRTTLDCGPAGLSNRPDLNILLWILLIGRVSGCDLDENQYFLGELVRVCGYLDFRRKSDFQKCLDEVGPALQPFNRQYEELCADIEEFNDDVS